MLRKVCLQLGRERYCSRARPSPRATSSRRPASSVLLRKVANEVGSEEDGTSEKAHVNLVNKQPSGFRFHQVLRCFRVV